MRAHVIENGIVVNTIEVESLDFMPGLIDADAGGNIGDLYIDGQFVSPNTPASTIFSRVDFMDRFTLEETVAIYTAAKQNVIVEILLDKLKIAEFVNVTDPRTAEGIQMLEQAGLIGAGRAAEILAST